MARKSTDEDSPADKRKDAAGAKKRGISADAYEDSPADRMEDSAKRPYRGLRKRG